MRSRRPFSRAADAVIGALHGEAGAGALLIAAAAAALAAANSPFGGLYHDVFHHRLAWTPVARLDTAHAWINDGLMAVFFFVVGLEIKREVLDGELASPAQRRLPVLAALAGMIVPAALFLAVTRGDPALQPGWAIPAATDIAFAVGVLALLGKRVPPSLRVFLLTVAIVDDLGAVAIIALVYTKGLDLAWLGAAAACCAALAALGWRKTAQPAPYVALGLLLWFAVLHSGVHATVAGVLAALAVPLAPVGSGDSMLLRFEHALAPVSAYLIVPVFALANAGVALGGIGVAGLLAPLPLGIALGLALGKQLGIFGAIVLTARSGLARPPAGASMIQLWGMALLCGIGFTMSLFIGGLAFPTAPALVEEAKLGVLAGSLLSAVAGYLVLRLAKPA